MTDDASTPKGWPPGYSVSKDMLSREKLVSFTSLSSDELQRKFAWAHYRTTREYRLEQLLRAVMADGPDYLGTAWMEAARKELGDG